MPFVQNWGVWMKIICRPAALSALMRCHFASLIICQAMLITYNCPQAGGAFSFPRMEIFWKSACTTFVTLLFKLYKGKIIFNVFMLRLAFTADIIICSLQRCFLNFCLFKKNLNVTNLLTFNPYCSPFINRPGYIE